MRVAPEQAGQLGEAALDALLELPDAQHLREHPHQAFLIEALLVCHLAVAPPLAPAGPHTPLRACPSKPPDRSDGLSSSPQPARRWEGRRLSVVVLLLGLGQPLRELFGIAGRDQLILGGVATRRHCPVVAGRAATPDRPSRVQAPQLLESDVLAGSASCGAHPGGRQAANVAGCPTGVTSLADGPMVRNAMAYLENAGIVAALRVRVASRLA